MEGSGEEKGKVCVTGGTGYLASWLIMKLLQKGYFVHTTIRSDPDWKEDLSYLTSLSGASERLQIFYIDFSEPKSFEVPIRGCMGVFLIDNPNDSKSKESEVIQTEKAVTSTLGILQVCLDSESVKRVIYTSSASAVVFHGKDIQVMDEESWTDVEFVKIKFRESDWCSYYVSKTSTEMAARNYAQKHGLDLVTIIPSFVHGPFICPRCPLSVIHSMAMIFDHQELDRSHILTRLVHVDDLANAQIFLLEHPNANGRYICSAVEIMIDKLYEILSVRYPEIQIPIANFAEMIKGFKSSTLSSKKLLEAGFKFKYGIEEMYDGAIGCCKKKGFL